MLKSSIFRNLILVVVGIFVLIIDVAAQVYPNKTITVIVPYAPGGNLDVIARLVAQGMSKNLGQSLVIDNKPGAGGILGHQIGARANPDGYTITTTANGSFAISPRLQAKMPFKSSDFIPVGTISVTPLVLEVNPNGRFKTINELLAYAKANPQKISIGHSGNGTTNHVAILMLQELAKVKFNIIPYKGSAPAITDLLANQIDAVIDQLPSSMSNLSAGKLRALAVTTADRVEDLATIPTFAESGFKGFEVTTTTGFLVPANTPESVVSTLNKSLNLALQQPEIQKKMRELNSEALQSTPAQFKQYLSKEEVKAEALVKRGLLKEE